MWDGYLGAIKETIAGSPHMDAEKIDIVVDRFHVAKNCRDAFEHLRKAELRRLKKELDDTQYAEVCKGMMWILRYNHRKLTPEQRQRLRPLFVHSPLLHLAYTLREEFTAIFDTQFDRETARLRLTRWMEKVESSVLSCYDKFLTTLRNHFDPIINYFHRRANSGFVEGFNNKLRVLTRRCYGIKRLDTLTRRLRLFVRNRHHQAPPLHHA